ncbi:MAG: hypothetical protein FJ276_13430 [Planctomycetes bacterium]|nr:hypothetical protein [Planctomycetota bacterium]
MACAIAVEYPGTAPGPAGVSIDGSEFTLSNQILTATWTFSNDRLRHARYRALERDATLEFAGDVFQLVLADGTVYRAAEMNLTGPVTVTDRPARPDSSRAADRTPERQLQASLVSADGRVQVMWRAVLLDHANYVRQEIAVSVAAEPVELREVIWLRGPVASAECAGTVDGVPVIAGPFFFGCEDPMAENRVERSEDLIGSWSPNDFRTGRRQLKKIPLTSKVPTDGPLDIVFQYKSGPHRLDIFGVELLEDGRVIAEDRHHGSAGTTHVDHVYRLRPTEWKPDAAYELVAELDTDPDFQLPAEQTINSSGSVIAMGERGDTICRLPRSATLSPGTVWTQSFVVGVSPEGQLRRAFLCYVERERAHPYRPHLHYNSWYDIAWQPFALNEQNCREAIDLFGRRLIARHDVVLDSMVFDDGWDDPQTLWRFHAGFPNGFQPLARACEDNGTRLGVWLSPFGGYGEPRRQRLEFGKSQGYEINPTGFSLAGPKYYAAFKEACVGMIRDYRVNHFKFDGIATGMYAQGGAEYVRDTEAIQRLMLELRDEAPDLFINFTTGSWPSPFWLRYADTLWRQGHDMGFAGPGSKQQQWLTYRDQAVHRNIVRRSPLYPLNALMTQGVAYSRHGPAGEPSFDAAGFKDDVRAFFGAGTSLQELYIQPDKLTEDDWSALAEAARWSRANADVLVDTHWIGGDPARLDVYGYASWSPRKGIVMLRNPGVSPQDFALDVRDAFELPPGAARSYRLQSPWREDAERPIVAARAGEPLTVSLRPFETIVWDAIPQDR